MKIEDIYKLPMLSENGTIYSDDCRYTIIFDKSDRNCDKQADIVTVALNNHDKLLKMVKAFDAYCSSDKDYMSSPFEATVIELINQIETKD
jgi:hypothetical protein